MGEKISHDKFSLEIFTLRGKQREKRERKKEVEKLLVRGKSRFGTLHCVRNMKMELGRMTESFHCPASGVSQGQKVGFLSRTFQFLGEPHPLVLVPPPPPLGKLTSRDILKRGTLLPSSSWKVIPRRETRGPVCSSNSEVGGTLPFSRDENYISSVITRRQLVLSQTCERSWVERTWAAELIRVVGNPAVVARCRLSKIELSLVPVSDF